ncbi:MAG TPA: hypothetical protein VNG32_05190 [Candidatus Dormibacteraeota bacterium]|nr:hypothetical protein [Candidatus Dormibacteraeota bacterium]
MADFFDVDSQYFAVVQGVDECPPTVTYAARLGIWLGDWEVLRGTVRSPVPETGFTVDVDGDSFDTRKGLTGAVYQAMVVQNPNDFGPDTPIRSIRSSGIFFPRTWITGDSATPHWAPAGHVDLEKDGSRRAEIWGQGRHYDHNGDGISFRPAIQLPAHP